MVSATLLALALALLTSAGAASPLPSDAALPVIGPPVADEPSSVRVGGAERSSFEWVPVRAAPLWQAAQPGAGVGTGGPSSEWIPASVVKMWAGRTAEDAKPFDVPSGWRTAPVVLNFAHTPWRALDNVPPDWRPAPVVPSLLPLPWTWNALEVAGHRPRPREGHATVEVGDRIYVLGGCAQELQCFNDVWIFNAGQSSWTQDFYSGDWPEARGGHTANLVGSKIYIYGGANSQETFGSVYVLDLVQKSWSRAEEDPTPGAVNPGRRTNHASAVDGKGRVFIFGGYDFQGRFLNDTWVLSTSLGQQRGSLGAHAAAAGVAALATAPVRAVWSRPATTGELPEAREGHTLTLVDRKLVLFGGYGVEGVALNDVHMYDLDTLDWTRLDVAAPLPMPRTAHTAVRHGRSVIVAGGCNVAEEQPICFGDVWSLDLVELRWTLQSSGSTSWRGREGHSATFVRGKMYTFGGCELGLSCFDEVVSLDTFEPCPAACGGHGICAHQQLCQCTVPGFGGHDCGQPVSCPVDCGQHGICTGEGRCQCENGWGGEDCSTELRCPGQPSSCSGHGLCMAGGRCKCVPGWDGPDCGISLSLLQEGCPLGCCGRGDCQAGSCQCSNGWYGSACALNRSAWDSFLSHRRAASRHHSQAEVLSLLSMSEMTSSCSAAPLASMVEVLSFGGGTGKVEDQNTKACAGGGCHSQGVCQSGVCFCKPGFYGVTCAAIKARAENTIGIAHASVMAASGFGSAFIATLSITKWMAARKHRQDIMTFPV
mmetsp:Transcript_81129/g.262848  ORF Transcript_81129/g.262848 Transcript_81129/m.262848 type:complete len:767 (-) Transcript_81129:68-2368(-)